MAKKTMTDLDLVKNFQNGDLDAGTEFIQNHLDEIIKISRFHAHKVCYDYALGYELKKDCVSEGVLAAYDAIKTYDFTGSSIMTYINTKIKFAFMSIKRNNAKHSERYEIGKDEYIESVVDDNSEDNQLYFKESLEKVLKQLDPTRNEWSIIRLYYNAMVRNIPSPINYVARETGYSTVGIRNIIRHTAQILPGQLTAEVRSMLMAA